MTDKLLTYVSLTEKQKAQIKETAPSFELIESISDAGDVSEIKAVLGWDKEELKELLSDSNNRLKWIQLTSAGADYVDFDQLKSQGITLTNTSGIHAHAIAESIMGMILNHTRKIGYSLIQQRQKNWEPAEDVSVLNKKTMLIVGAGSIGKQTGKVAQAFGMKTIGMNRSGGSVDFMDELVTQDQLQKYCPKQISLSISCR